MIVTDDRVMRFVSERIGRPIVPPYTCMGTEIGGEIVNGVVFNDFTGADIHATVAGKRWSRGFLGEIGHYIFGQLGCLRITVTTEQPIVVQLAERLGGKVEGLLRNQFGQGRDGFIVGILRDDWRY